MALLDDEDKGKPRAQPLLLDPLSVEELEAYIARLEAEIARVRAAIARKQDQRGAAAQFFKS